MISEGPGKGEKASHGRVRVLGNLLSHRCSSTVRIRSQGTQKLTSETRADGIGHRREKNKKQKPQHESSAGFGQTFASRWLFVLEICQVWIHVEGVTEPTGLRRSLVPSRWHACSRGDDHTLSSASQDLACQCALPGLQQEISVVECRLADKGENGCRAF